MAIEVNGKTIETNDNGYLLDHNQWDENVAKAIADVEGLELTQEHMDVIEYLRDEYINNNANQPNDRMLIKAMTDKWGRKVSSKELYDLFPGKPSKQAGLLAGLPESRRKGGY
ncbi:MAG: TusE/DsrC/DsvC family sulfur relay protein [Gammaproteobacteria bacterium]|nr:TusE/DsrC/DsvC family sulfur relay protein [Gammaproteobacteria bacterium]